MRLLTADTETTTDPNDCRVWAYGLCEINEDYKFTYGKDLDDMFSLLFSWQESVRLYFHNLKFDGEFLFVWLFEHGFEHVKDRKELEPGKFTTLISDMGVFYSIDICYGLYNRKKLKITVYDSLKILPLSVADIAKGFKLPEQKLDIDYHQYRPIGYEMTELERSYLEHDVKIVAKALKSFFDEKMDKMTQGSNALTDYKEIVGKKAFKKWFPTPSIPVDEFIRKSYKGGFTYLNPRYKNKDVGKGIVLDVNSLYPSRMYYCEIPYGEPLYFEGQYQEDKVYNLYVQRLRCRFKIKKNHIPTLQLKGNLTFTPTEYVIDSKGEEIELTMTSVDLKLFLEQYNVYEMQYLDGYKMKSSTVMFKDYIDKWYNRKAQAKEEKNHALYILSKLMQNGLYGKLALSPKVRSKYPYYEDGKIRYELGKKEEREPIYIPAGTFITAHARYLTITSAQKVYHRFIYADTDSLHLEGTKLPKDLEIDAIKLGAWDHEKTFTRARFIRSKCYIEEVDGKLEVTCAGLPAKCHGQVTWDNFRPGAVYTGKLSYSHVVGGVVLKDVAFTIKD